ncbi:MAG: formate--tetrahydrofolate ligase [Myxococcales bacterium]|nr:formate--tetrahydrofolate ligase [Myxococcales bacterium]
MRRIEDVADAIGLPADAVLPWGPQKAKIRLEATRPAVGRLILVSAMNPTPGGEGKTTMSISLAMGLCKRGRNAIVALREPSLGPIFGMKGGGTGGGRATVEPADDINLHFTGDIHAITTAHNLLAAMVDNALYFREGPDPRKVRWRRAMDMNDRSLRRTLVGLDGAIRETGFDITAASEVMAIHGLFSDAADLEARLGRIIVGDARDGTPVRAADLGAAGAMTALLRDAMMPNLVQTAEGTPALVHGGPFANIAHGCSSLVQTRLALGYAQDVVTEAGFGFDLGGEKFFDIKCRAAGLWPSAVVLVATARALKYHGGADGKALSAPDDQALERGFGNLDRHLDSIASFGVPAIVVVNRFPDDRDGELSRIRRHCEARGVPVAVCDAFARGGDGALELADVLLGTPPGNATPAFTYPMDASYPAKLTSIATRFYGAREVILSPEAKVDLAGIETIAGSGLPVCVAKTPLSLTDDPLLRGSPRDFPITVRRLRLAAGAGFVVALTGEIMTMPGLPRTPSAARVRLEPDGKIRGLMQGD